MDRDKLLDRIRRLLRLAESSNVHEAATAAARAQELMARHRIEAAALDAASDDHGIRDLRDAPLDSSKRLRSWKVQLGNVIAQANGCRIYVLERAGMRSVVLVGRPEDAELVRALYGELLKRVECLTREHGRGRDRSFCNAFRLGVVTTLGERLALASSEAKRRALEGSVEEDPEDAEGRGTSLSPSAHDAASTSLALARLEEREEAVERFMEAHLRLRRGRKQKLRADAEGYARGRVAGHGVTIEPSGS